MSEAMAAEMIIEAEWILKGGYWSKLRHPFQTENGGWSDIDVLSYSPATKHVVISESKVRGPKNHVRAYTEHSKNHYGDILDYDGYNYFSFLHHLPSFFRSFSEKIDRVTIQLVSNQVVDDSLMEEAKRTVKGALKSKRRNVEYGVMLDTTLDVLARVIELERYLHPRVRYAGGEKSKTEAVRRQGLQHFWRAINGEELAVLLTSDATQQ